MALWVDGHVSERTSGRAGSNSYQINENALVRTSETLESNRKNPIAAFAESSYDTIRQIFNMGIGEMRPESLVWEGNAFSALRGAGVPFYGRLVISNGLPFAVETQ